MVILVMVVIFRLGRDAEKLEYGKSYLGRSMDTAIMTMKTGLSLPGLLSSYNIKQTRRSLSESSASQNAYESSGLRS